MQDFAAFTDDDPREKSTRVLLDRLEIAESGALDPDPRPGLPLPLEDGPPHRRRAGRRRARRDDDGAGGCAASGARAARRDVTPAALTAPAAGLFLEGVYYEGDAGPGPLKPMIPIE